MKKAFFLMLVGLLSLAGTAYVFVPLSPGKDICSALEPWGAPDAAAARLNHPMGLAWTEGVLYVADTENGEIKKFRRDGSLAARWSGFKRPVAVAAAGEVVYVADFLDDRITKLGLDGTVITRWGRQGSESGAFDAPSGIAVDGQGNVYVADFYNHRIQKFTGDGTFLLQWGGEGRWSGRFRFPTEVAVNDRGEVFVADAYNHRVQKFTSDGAYVAKWGGMGYGMPGGWPGWFRLAKALTVDSRGHLYVADAFNRRVQKFTGQGELLGQLGARRSGPWLLRYPAGVAAGPRGRVYVSDFFENRIWKAECRSSR